MIQFESTMKFHDQMEGQSEPAATSRDPLRAFFFFLILCVLTRLCPLLCSILVGFEMLWVYIQLFY